MKEKIEEIVNKKLAYCPVEGNSDIYRVHRYRVEELKGEISTLIQEERKDSFRGFMDWRKKILEKTLSKSEVDCIMADYGIGFEEYLESEGK